VSKLPTLARKPGGIFPFCALTGAPDADGLVVAEVGIELGMWQTAETGLRATASVLMLRARATVTFLNW
jgi:hypothetical protein